MLAAPGDGRAVFLIGDGRKVANCDYCGEVIIYDPRDLMPNWFHRISGGRVCGSQPLPGYRPPSVDPV